MNDTKKTILTTAAVTAACGFCVAGSYLRDAADLGGQTLRASRGSMQSWVASRDNEVNVPVGDFYDEMTRLLKEQYVEPVKDDQKLASGAVRGMIASLGESHSVFMDKDEFRAFLNARTGKYEGIGADFILKTTDGKPSSPLEPPAEDAGDAVSRFPHVPRLVVTMVVPGGPADKAGVKAGDEVSEIDGHWVVEDRLLQKFRKAQRDFGDKKISYAEINAMQKDLRKRTERALLPSRAKDRLLLGRSGTIKVKWRRGESELDTTIVKAPSTLPPFEVKGDEIRLPLDSSAVESLQKAIAGKTSLTLDLRNNVNGDLDTARKCLAVLAPAGQYGAVFTSRHEKPTPFAIASGNSKPPKITLKVDGSTRGGAEVLALALSSKGIAKLTGSDTGGDRTVSQVVQLPDGSGYTLAVGEYRPIAPKVSVVASKESY